MAERGDVSITVQIVVSVDDEGVNEAEGLWDTSDLARALRAKLAELTDGELGDHIVDQFECDQDGV